jgi:hypothetical protein
MGPRFERAGTCGADRLHARWKSACVLILLGVLLGLVPLAHAQPPDQTWLGGIYDDADYDDIVVMVSSATGATEALRSPTAPATLLVIGLPGAHALVPPAPPLLTSAVRGPPS